jgi:hypothetical protein
MLLKKYSDLGGGKKKSDSEFLSYNLMLNSGKTISNSSYPKKILNGKKKTTPPLQVKWSVPQQCSFEERCLCNYLNHLYPMTCA